MTDSEMGLTPSMEMFRHAKRDQGTAFKVPKDKFGGRVWPDFEPEPPEIRSLIHAGGEGGSLEGLIFADQSCIHEFSSSWARAVVGQAALLGN